jgi:hypothetical protein
VVVHKSCQNYRGAGAKDAGVRAALCAAPSGSRHMLAGVKHAARRNGLPNTDCGEGSPRHAALQQQLVVSTPGHLPASLSVSTCRGLGLPRSLLADLSGCFARTPALYEQI